MDAFYDSPAWREFAARIVDRDGSRCTVGWLLGGACSDVLHVHHVEPRSERPDLEFDPHNCATVCSSHHPRWEALRRRIVDGRNPVLPPCPHKHPYESGRIACERRRMREAGLLDDRQLVAV